MTVLYEAKNIKFEIDKNQNVLQKEWLFVLELTHHQEQE